MTAKVSVITTVFNGERWIGDAVDSVMSPGQIFRDVDFVVVDDGSTDRTRKQIDLLMAKYSPRDIGICFLGHRHEGRIEQLIAGGLMASPLSNYLGLLDADDLLHPECLARCVKIMDENPSASFVYTDHADMEEDGTVLGIGAGCHALNTRENHLRGFTTQHFRLMRRSAFDAVGGFDPSFETAMDYDLCLRLEEWGPVLHMPEILYYKRRHPNQISVLKAEQQKADAYRARRLAIDRDAAKRRAG